MPSHPARLWVFNPGHEEALLVPEAKHYTLSREIRQMRHELAPLLALLADPSDLLYIPPSADGSVAPCLRWGDGTPATPDALPDRLEVQLWGIDPHILKELQRCPLFRATVLALPRITPPFLRLSHRSASTDLLNFLIQHGGYPEALLPLWVEAGADRSETKERLREAIASVSGRPIGAEGQVLVKRPYTSSGRGVLPLPLPAEDKHLDAFVGNMMKVGSISVEPFLRVVDNWAIEYQREPQGKVRFYALSHFETLASGRAYSGNALASPRALWEELTSHIGQEHLLRLIELQRSWLEDQLRDSEYTGYIGIDLFLYEEQGQWLLHPCVEINLRTTMGVVAHRAYLRYLAPDRSGRFVLGYQREASPSFVAYIESEGEKVVLSE